MLNGSDSFNCVDAVFDSHTHSKPVPSASATETT